MNLAPFAAQARSRASTAGEMLLALESEFHAVDAREVDQSLTNLAEPFCRSRGLRPRPLSEEQLLAGLEGFRARGDDDPAHLLFSPALRRRAGHSLLLAVLVQEAARRVGVPLAVLGGSTTWVVGDARFEPGVFVDPASRSSWPPAGRPPELLKPMCAHQVAFAVTARLAAAFWLRGDIARALRAADLRLWLPMPDELRGKVAFERDRLKACLN